MNTARFMALAWLSLTACDAPPPANPPRDVRVVPQPQEPIDIGLEASRPRRRMDIEQLDRSIERATGRRWMSGTTPLFESNAATLGVPDYLQTTSEDLEASALFVKFLDDAARSVCTSLIEQDPDAPAADRIFFRHAAVDSTNAAEIERNLQYLLLRYHGRRVELGSTELAAWVTLLGDARAAAATPDVAWRTICVALIDHPDFYTY